ncbi:MAG: TrkA family potassium uptake protein, partial [Candidatus Eisenbacteria bacterium]|nr:TrkA family potassium uptake protein [Candidatus Eisenbacteria bacterium]
LGQFGRELAVEFMQHAEVVAIDADQKAVNEIADHVHQAYCVDARDSAGLAAVVNEEFDEAIVGLSQNMEASILAVLHLKRIGVKRVHAKARNRDHAQILEAIGADNIVFPERETARRLVKQVLNPNLLDFVPISDDYSVMQLAPPKEFVGVALKDLDLRRRFGVFVIAVKELVPERTHFLPGPEFVVKDDIVLVVIGKHGSAEALSPGTNAKSGKGS